MAEIVELMVRKTCGSCDRVREQIKDVIAQAGVEFRVCDVEDDPQLQVEFGDRVPVVVIDGEEFACWEVDNAELANALL
ncbi:Glutaredoxin-like domain (DUF836) [Corynebacterium mustelae]|uniref:Glutaredoxin-like domain (DUF836) n=2 Tax=Corynebacterium mustelae TaxID=571915 RepID=A0A0G3GYS7_9CORY|nr:Glutaredoxin-like domain (DUF836) [Corynebacterium mustelae]